MEHQFHDWLKSKTSDATESARPSTSKDPAGRCRVTTGIGDDAAIIDFAGQPLVITTDAIAEGTHFRLPEKSQIPGTIPTEVFERIGRKALAVSLSDIAAMGATPFAATLSFQCPKRLTIDDLKALYNGAARLAAEFELEIVGGDTNTWSDGLVVSSTVFGTRSRQLTGWSLDGAQNGDAIYVSGAFGGSIHGRHFDFEPRLRLARHLADHYQINSATDASDSLTMDLMAIAKASEMSFVIDLDSVPISNDVQASEKKSALSHALSDGEDFELIFTVDAETALRLDEATDLPTRITQIGRVENGSPALHDQSRVNEFLLKATSIKATLEPWRLSQA